METVTIYNGEEYKIDVRKDFYDFVERLNEQSYRLNQTSFDIILKMALSILEINKIDFKKPTVIGQILVVEAGTALKTEPPFDCINDFLLILGLCSNIRNSRARIDSFLEMEGLSDTYFYHIFDRKIFGIDGFALKKTDKESDILFFFSGKEESVIDLLDFLE